MKTYNLILCLTFVFQTCEGFQVKNQSVEIKSLDYFYQNLLGKIVFEELNENTSVKPAPTGWQFERYGQKLFNNELIYCKSTVNSLTRSIYSERQLTKYKEDFRGSDQEYEKALAYAKDFESREVLTSKLPMISSYDRLIAVEGMQEIPELATSTIYLEVKHHIKSGAFKLVELSFYITDEDEYYSFYFEFLDTELVSWFTN